MRQMHFEKLEDTYKSKLNQAKEVILPSIKKTQIVHLEDIKKEQELPNLDQLLDMRVSRFKRTLKYHYDGYKDYLKRKLLGSASPVKEMDKNKATLQKKSPKFSPVKRKAF